MGDSPTQPRALTVAEQAVVSMAKAGADIAVIADQSGLSRAQIVAAVDLAAQHRRGRAAQAAAAPTRQKAGPAPQPIVQPQPDPPKRTVPPDLDDVLAWAETRGTTRARTLAAAVRVRLAELMTLHEREIATAEQRKIVEVLERQLADAKAALHATGAAPAGGQDSVAIRDWAREHGHEVPPRGRVPKHIVAAWRRDAHPDGA
ncbi:MAG: Lsr2 family DNA-binding protein [Actinocrinis sp.]